LKVFPPQVIQLKYFIAAMARSFFFKPVPHEVGTWEAIETITKQPKKCYVSLERWGPDLKELNDGE
jgi:hypothetical protein